MHHARACSYRYCARLPPVERETVVLATPLAHSLAVTMVWHETHTDSSVFLNIAFKQHCISRRPVTDIAITFSPSPSRTTLLRVLYLIVGR